MPAARASAAKAPITLRDSTRVSVSNGNSFVAVKSGTSGGVLYAVGWHATNPDTAWRISRASGRSRSGFRRQFTPMMSAPASRNARAHSAGEWPSYDFGSLSNDIVTMDGMPVFSIRSMASRASPSQENVSAITKDDALFELLEDAHLCGSVTPAAVSLGHDRREGRPRLIV